MMDDYTFCVLGEGYCRECLECLLQNKEIESEGELQLSTYELNFDLNIKIKDPNGIKIEENFSTLAKVLEKALMDAIDYNHVNVIPRSFELVWEEDCPILIFDDYDGMFNAKLESLTIGGGS